MNSFTLAAFGREFLKMAAPLTAEARSELPNKDFALTGKQSETGKPAYPIEDKQHAKSALGFVGMHGSSKEKSEVYKDIAKKYPDIAAHSSVPALKKRAGVASSLGRQFAQGKGVVKQVGEHLAEHGSAYDLAGLGVLAAPSAHNLYHAAQQRRAGAPVDRKEVGHSAAEIGGLGVLAAPVAAGMLLGKKGH